MNIKTLVTIGGLLVGSYWTGKIVGAHKGAKVALDKYDDVIQDEKLEVKLVDNALCRLTVIAKKGES